MYESSFTASEWRTLQFAPLWVFTAVAGADKKIDDKEMAAMSKELSEALLFKDLLAREVIVSVATDFENIMRLYNADSRDVLEGLKDTADILDRKADQDRIRGFKGALLLIARNIAEASGGGMFGMGEKVSKEEKTALVLVAMALRAQL
jgi:hypothetical protein